MYSINLKDSNNLFSETSKFLNVYIDVGDSIKIILKNNIEKELRTIYVSNIEDLLLNITESSLIVKAKEIKHNKLYTNKYRVYLRMIESIELL